MTTCEEVRLALGAHALGALDEDEAREIDDHLATCEVCGAELLDLSGVASFLGKVSERDVELVASPPRQVLDRLLDDRARRRRRGRLLMAVAASAVVLVGGGAVWTSTQGGGAGESAAPAAQAPASARSAPAQLYDGPQSDAEEPRAAFGEPSASATESAGDMTLAEASGREYPGKNAAKGYAATVTVIPAERGTMLNVSLSGVPAGTSCELVVVTGDGKRDSVKRWTIDSEPYRTKATSKPVFSSRTKWPMHEIVKVEVLDAAGTLLVAVPVT
ncbi:zf-HC2 domain-containing protein [Nonomuraea sp. NN258]|uniref:zf-HC2 domain-containing protein n=1 Tax=Nonomuraea antri TaxID=2730852 RepID=UPI00156A27AD|nr:zf-HC2 domain-containing protein [Nonomuraea antri]NRQ33140.1 zf-HC2 domain-containing protein [Nonomuraea antri]